MLPLVLVIDDNDDDRRIIVTFLRYFGFVVVDASDGPRGLALARSWRPAVAVVDMAMPGLSGSDIGTAIRSDPELAGMKLIAVSVHPEYQTVAEHAGFDLFLTKPIAPNLLLDAVRRLLSQEPPSPGESMILPS